MNMVNDCNNLGNTVDNRYSSIIQSTKDQISKQFSIYLEKNGLWNIPRVESVNMMCNPDLLHQWQIGKFNFFISLYLKEY